MISVKDDFKKFGLEENTDVARFLSMSTSEQNLNVLTEWHRRSPWVSPVVPRGSFEIFDFTKGYDANRKLKADFGLGRYDENRVGMYSADFFKGTEPANSRTIHMGVDLGAPVGTPCFAPLAASLHGASFLDRKGDYGGTVILECKVPPSLNCPVLYMLFGHLSKASVSYAKSLEEIHPGDLIGWLGGSHENGGWNSHLHWQLSWGRPSEIDLPGAVSENNREMAKLFFPDPTPLLKVAIGGWSTRNEI